MPRGERPANGGAVKERPIPFKGPMVRAILEGRKTQTRRLIKPCGTLAGQPMFPLYIDGIRHGETSDPEQDEFEGIVVSSTRYTLGDLLWVREAWAQRLDLDHLNGTQLYAAGIRSAWYWADGPGKCYRTGCAGAAGRVRAARFMPRWASRITLEVLAVKVERLQEISPADAEDEGVVWESADPPFWYVPGIHPHSITGTEIEDGAAACFAKLWNHLHGAGAWDANPWVTALTFRRVAP